MFVVVVVVIVVVIAMYQKVIWISIAIVIDAVQNADGQREIKQIVDRIINNKNNNNNDDDRNTTDSIDTFHLPSTCSNNNG